jgi:hypothetical protein
MAIAVWSIDFSGNSKGLLYMNFKWINLEKDLNEIIGFEGLLA